MSTKKIGFLELSYPSFALGQIIDPEEVNQNNTDVTNKINDIIDSGNNNTEDISNLLEIKADITYVDDIHQSLLDITSSNRSYTDSINQSLLSKIAENKTEINKKSDKVYVDGINSNLLSKISKNISDIQTAKAQSTTALSNSNIALTNSNNAIGFVNSMQETIRSFDEYISARLAELHGLMGHAMLDFGYFLGGSYSLYNIDCGTFNTIPDEVIDVMDDLPLVS